MTPPSIAAIQAAVAEHYHLRASDMTSRNREIDVVRPRMVAMFLARELTHKSFPNIGIRFNRDHTTVIHACRAVEHRIATQEAVATNVLLLRERIHRQSTDHFHKSEISALVASAQAGA